MRRALRVVLLGVAMVLLAAGLGVPELYVPGITLVLLALAAETSVALAAWRVRVTREPQTARIEEGESLRLALRIHSPLPVRGELSGWPGAPFRAIPRRRDASIELTARALRRGAHVIGPARARFRDPFGIAVRTASSAASEVLVLPRVERVRASELARIGALARPGQGPANDVDGIDVDGLRPYRHGAPASRIHWPTVARTSTLVERRIHDRSDGTPLIVLDSTAPASAEHLDRAVRAAASLCVAFAKLGGCRVLLPGWRQTRWLGPDLAGWPELHSALALVEPDEPLLWRARESAGAVLWVSARSAAPSRGVRAGELRYVVSPLSAASQVPPGSERGLIEVGGCAIRPAARPGSSARAHAGRAA